MSIVIHTMVYLKLCVFLFIVELNSEHAQKAEELEQAMKKKLRERQKLYEQAFKQDMQQYLTTGHVQQSAKSLPGTAFFLYSLPRQEL